MSVGRYEFANAGGKLRVTWVRSAIGRTKNQALTIRALGLRRMHQSVEVPNVESVRGMVYTVRHLVSVEAVES